MRLAPDSIKPDLRCPIVETVVAKPLRTTEIVNWDEPVANDNKDGRIT